MIIVGEVLDTLSATKESESSTRPRVESLHLIKEHGIEYDKFAGKNLDRSVMVVGHRAYDEPKTYDIVLSSGDLGENILLDFDPHNFAMGTVFQIGDAKIEVMEPCTICTHLAKYDARLPKLIENYRGLYCKIIQSGVVKAGQTVYMR